MSVTEERGQAQHGEAERTLLDEVPVQVVPGRPTWIEASAGTGKTWTLERIVAQRVREGASLESILVVTFTEKATREMRSRIRQTLSAERDAIAEARARGRPADELAEARFGQALVAFDRATISTLHGFCRRTLREHAFLSGRALDEEHEGGRALAGTWFRAWLARDLDAGGLTSVVLAASLEVMGVSELETLLLALSSERAPLLPLFDEPELVRALEVIPTGAPLEALLVDLVELAGAHPAARIRMGAVLRALDLARNERGQLRLAALLRWGASGPGTTPVENHAAWLAHKLAPHPTLGAAAQVIARALMTPVPALAALALPSLAAELAREKRRAAVVDFDDLVSGMVEALEGPRGSALARALRERYRHVVVDEFQDTDPDQWKILARLFLDCEPQTTAPRTFVLIGDPKQAIYGFRGADVHTYWRAKREVEETGTLCRLGISFRATPALLDAVHRIIVPEPGEPPFFTQPGGYEKVRAGNPARSVAAFSGGSAEALPPITVLRVEGEPPLRMRPARRALARAIAEAARALLTEDVRVTDGTPGGGRRLVASDLFVLTRSIAEGLEVAEALSEAGVAHAFFKQDGLFRTAEAQDFSDLLSALVSPEDVGKRARALATPFFAVASEDFARIAELPFEHPLLERFRSLAEHASRHDVAGLLAAILRETGLTRRELYLFRSERRLTNYLHLGEALTTLALEHRAGPRELASRLAQLTRGEVRLGETEDVQRLPSERAAVQLLTMHKAKGLEAEVVFVYGGLGRPRGSPFERRIGTRGGERIAWLLPSAPGTSDAAIEASIEREELEESERLLYVAMTRARSLLYLPSFAAAAGADTAEAKGRAKKIRGPYRVVHDRLEILRTAGQLTLPLFRVEEVALGRRGPRPTRRKELFNAPAPVMPSAHAAAAPDSLFDALRASSSGTVITSYTRMKREHDRRAEGEREGSELEAIARYLEPRDPDAASASPEDPGGASYGVAVHRALELLPIELARAAESAEALARHPEVQELYLGTLAASGVDERAMPLLARMVHAALRTPVRAGPLALPDLATPLRRAAEVPFLELLPEPAHPPLGTPPSRRAGGEGRGLLRGVIDLVFEHEGALFLVDWKTDRLADYEEGTVRAHVTERYDIQTKLYALALRRMIAMEKPARPATERFGGVLYVMIRGLIDERTKEGAPASGFHFARPTEGELVGWDHEMRTKSAPFGYPLGLSGDARGPR